jgi:hypothetical protein
MWKSGDVEIWKGGNWEICEADPALAGNELRELLAEAGELTAIFTASHATATRNLREKKAGQKKRRAT